MFRWQAATLSADSPLADRVFLLWFYTLSAKSSAARQRAAVLDLVAPSGLKSTFGNAPPLAQSRWADSPRRTGAGRYQAGFVSKLGAPQ
jgi:hypothetical protein